MATTTFNVVERVDSLYLQNAVQILDQLADIGKTIPYIAPAFILLKLIIEVEKRAQEVDAKCIDLIDRITFMLSHLPALNHTSIADPTRHVIERINTALKNAAALIVAYRKQSRIVRRLSLNNRDKFIACADTINLCSADLMISLQIHQTGKLDTILTTAVPLDNEDIAARSFVAAHGSLSDIIHSSDLVSQFAEQQHMPVDDRTLEQLNTNISLSIHHSQSLIDHYLKENISTALTDTLHSLITKLHAADTDQRFTCVQCDNQFTLASNTPTACSFHRAEFSTWTQSFPCCSSSHPCEFASHRASHHSDYPYPSFFPRARAVLNYVDTIEKWIELDDTDLLTGVSQHALVGRLLSWVSRGASPRVPCFIVVVGTVRYDHPYYFNTFSAPDLLSPQPQTIFRTSPSTSEYAMAEWVLSSGAIEAIRLSVKSATSDTPFVYLCPIDPSTCLKSGDVQIISRGGLSSYTPNSHYTLPDTLRIGPKLSTHSIRSPRVDFKTRPTGNIILKTMSDPPLTANPLMASTEMDHFRGEISVYNNSSSLFVFASVSALYRLVGDADYVPVHRLVFTDPPLSLPVSIEPHQACSVRFQVSVKRSREDVQLDVRWYNRAFVARDRPLRIKMVVGDIHDVQCSLVLEYVFSPSRLDHKEEKDEAFFYFDDPVRRVRNGVRVEREKGVLRIDGVQVESVQLEKMVYRALASAQTEIKFTGREMNDGLWEWEGYALVDTSCRRVYAFKIVVVEGRGVGTKRFGCVGYVLCPEYGDVSGERREVRYAKEVVGLPDLEVYESRTFVDDDTVDDWVQSSSSSSSPQPVSSDVRLASIDDHLSRIATALEKIVEAMNK